MINFDILTVILYLTGGSDYITELYNVVIPAGEANVKFSVTIMDDNILETDETINLAINSNALPNKITRANPGRAVVTIVDNDGQFLKIFAKVYLRMEFFKKPLIVYVRFMIKRCQLVLITSTFYAMKMAGKTCMICKKTKIINKHNVIAMY